MLIQKAASTENIDGVQLRRKRRNPPPTTIRDEWERKLRHDTFAVWTYTATAYSLLVYGSGILFCAWAIASHEHGKLLNDSVAPSVWRASFAFDALMNSFSLVSTMLLPFAIMKLKRFLMLPWLLFAFAGAVKTLTQMVWIGAFTDTNIAVAIGSIQLIVALVQVLFVMTVSIKYDQIGRTERLIVVLQQAAVAKTNEANRRRTQPDYVVRQSCVF